MTPKISIPFFILIFILGFTSPAKAESKLTLTGAIYNAITSKPVPGAKVEVLDSTSNVLASTIARGEYYKSVGENQYVIEKRSDYYLSIPKRKGVYTLRVALEGFQQLEHVLNISKLGSRQSEYEIPNLYLRPERKETALDEVVVKASKVKFYNKGDTIIYNADAFQLPEGSMLDALITQLPGVEIRDGGAIYVNGKYVESLLLNGKDFFKGNNQIMLENLGAYMVNNIKVYEKAGDKSEMMGKKLIDDTQYVMDVKLKKDYMAGNLLNIKATGGTSSRFLGKVFGMHYTNNSRLTLYGDANNLNDTDKPNDGSNTRHYAPSSSGGLTDTYRGGIDYFADNPLHTWEINGNADFSFTKNVSDLDSYVTNFLSSGNTYSYNFNSSTRKNLGISTYHALKLKHAKWQLDLTPSFRYNHAKTASEINAASFSKEIDGISSDMIEKITDAGNNDADWLINRSLRKDNGLNHGFNARLFSEFFFKIKNSSDLTSIWLESNYDDYRSNRDNYNDITYGPKPFSDVLLKQIYKDVPNNDFKFNLGGKYYLNIPHGTTGFLYNFNHDDKRKSSDLFMFESRTEKTEKLNDNVGKYSVMDKDATDKEEPEMIFDPLNSYTSRQIENYHLVRPFYIQQFNGNYGIFTIKGSVELGFYNRNLDYNRGEIHANPKRNDFTVRIMDTFFAWQSKDYSKHISVSYDRTPSLLNLVDLVDFKDTTDPLNIQEGNPQLKNSITNSLSATFGSFKKNMNHNVRLEINWDENDIVRGYRYNSASGVRTFKAYNVGGNNRQSLSYYFYWNIFDKTPHNFYISNSLHLGNNTYADMVGVDSDPVKQKVRNSTISESLGLSYGYKSLKIYPFGRISYRHTRSASDMIGSFNAFDFEYGLQADYHTPFNLMIGTNMQMISRRGYSQSEMNDNQFIWDANIAYSMLKGALIFTLTGHDLAGQMKGISYSVDALGRTETHFNVLPRYVSLSVQYRFDFRPKREKQKQQ